MNCLIRPNTHLRFLIFPTRNFGRRPPHHKSIFKGYQFPYFNMYYDTDSMGPHKVVIDEINQHPPGLWGSMPFADAWKRHKEAKHLQKIGTLTDKYRSLSWSEYNMFYHTVELPMRFPETLNFAQFITRTKIVDGIPDAIKDSFANVSTENIKSACQILGHQIGNTYLKNKPFVPRHDSAGLETRSDERIMDIMDALVRGWRKDGFYENYTTVPKSKIETFIKRAGYQSLEVPEHVRDAEGCIHYRIRGNLTWNLRSCDPLKEFVSKDDPILVDDGQQYPMYNYHPKVFDLEPTDCFEFRHTPFLYSRDNSEYIRNIPGFWGTNIVKIGDPCAFSVLGVVNTNSSNHLLKDIKHEHPDVLNRHELAEGILAGFVWTLAQAQNQGFSIYDELTYPICASLLLTDGSSAQILYYQLNSISSLWKPEDTGLPVNIMWASDKSSLFTFDDKNKITGINEQIIHQILSCFSLPRASMAASELQPYLSEKAPQEVESFMIDFNPATATEKEIEIYKKRTKVRHLMTPTKVHPNYPFYFDEVNSLMLNKEFREIVPGVDSVPKRITRQLDLYQWKMAKSKGKKKLPTPPTPWR